MSNSNEYIKSATTYIGSVLGDNIVVKPVCKSMQDKLPISIFSNFKLYNGLMLSKDVLLTYVEDGNIITPEQTKGCFVYLINE